MNEKITALERLVTECAATEGEVKKLKRLRATLTQERDKLIESGSFDDEGCVQRAASILTQAEMIPHRLTKLEECVARQKASLTEPTGQLRDAIEAAAAERLRALVSAIEKRLSEVSIWVCPVSEVAAAVVYRTRLGAQLLPFTQRVVLHGTGPVEEGVAMVSRAKAFLQVPAL